MDRDVFARSNRLGRQLSEAVCDAIERRPWSSFIAARLVEHLIQTAGGVPSAGSVFDLMDDLHRSPYLPDLGVDPSTTELERILRECGSGSLDIVLIDAAKRGVLRRSTSAEVAEEFVYRMIYRHAFECRRGLVEARGAEWYSQHLPEIRRLLSPVVQRAARQLRARPDARVLNLTHSDRITADDDLRGAVLP